MNTQEPIFDAEDPRLTAYALGELTDPAECAEVEQTLQRSPEARETLREIRELTTALSTEYEQERRLVDPELPPNVVPMVPVSRADRAWPWRLLLAAAGLLLTATVARLMIVGGVGERRMATTHETAATSQPASQASPSVKLAESSNVKKADTPAPASEATRDDLRNQTITALPASPALLAQTRPAEPVPAKAERGKDAPFFDGWIDYGSPIAASAATPPPAAELPLGSTATLNLNGQFAAIDKQSSQSPPGALGSVAVVVPEQGRVDGAARRVQTVAPSAAPVIVIGDAARVTTAAPRLAKELAVQPPGFASGSTAMFAAAKPARMETLADTTRDREMPPAEDRIATRAKVKPADGFDTAAYEHLVENTFLTAKDNPLSTFSIDVDTASYANVRRFIESGRLPPPDAVRIEELVNYFPYNDTPPAPGDEHPFAVHLEAASCPWNPQDRLVRIGIKGRELARDKRPPSNLVFLLDVSGSMQPQERLPLIKASMRMLVERLTENDRVAIVTYAGNSGVALPSTTGDHKDVILRALEELHAGGSTNGASGIKLAYLVAREGFIKGGTNRVILATDGDFNVGVTNQGDLVRLIEHEAKSGVFLSALGVGTDNYKDATMQKLADKGNGNYAYLDRLDEARKVLVEQMSGTLVTIAKDVKIQLEFNPAAVAAYRLIGYEKRLLRKEDFNDDRIDAGEIGAGHSVTALYEIVPAGQSVPQAAPAVDALKYGSPAAAAVASPTPEQTPAEKPASNGGMAARELLTVKLRHKAPDGDKSERSYEESLTDHGAAGDLASASPDFKFAAAAAEFGLVLRDSPYKGEATLGSVLDLAGEGRGTDAGEHRAGFIELVRRAQRLQAARGE